MKILNVIREGDFVKLKTISELKEEGYTVEKSGILGGLDLCKDNKTICIIRPNARRELGNVVRLSLVNESSNYSTIYCKAESKGLDFPFENGSIISFEEILIESVLLNGHWYKADDNLNTLLL